MLLSTYFQGPLKTLAQFGLKSNANVTRAVGTISRMSTQQSVKFHVAASARPLETEVSRRAINTYLQANPRVFSRSRLTTREYASQSQSSADPPPGGRRQISLFGALFFSGFLASSSYLLGLFAPPEVFTLFNPRPIPPPPPEDSEEAKRIIARVENELNELPVLRKCREAPDASEWYEARPYITLPPERLANHFTAGVIRGPTKIAVPPIVRSRKDETETWVFLHLGTGICGHEGLVHGGLLATLLDEACARPAFLTFPSGVAVTANLNLNFRAPTRADQFVIMKTKLVELKGRKAIVEGSIETLDGKVLVDARGIYVEPKLAAQLYHVGIPAVYPSLRRNLERMAGAQANSDRSGGGGNVNEARVGVESEVKTR